MRAFKSVNTVGLTLSLSKDEAALARTDSMSFTP